jgi:hypothetical protein
MLILTASYDVMCKFLIGCEVSGGQLSRLLLVVILMFVLPETSLLP